MRLRAHSLSPRDMVVKIVRALEAHGVGHVCGLSVVRRFMPRHGPVWLGESPAEDDGSEAQRRHLR